MAEDRLGDYLPVAVGLGVGIGNRLLNLKAASHPHYTFVYKAVLFSAGLAGELLSKGSPNVNYGLMAATSTLQAEQITSAIADKRTSEVLTYQAPALPPRAAAHTCGSCSAGKAVHPLIAATTAPNVASEVH